MRFVEDPNNSRSEFLERDTVRHGMRGFTEEFWRYDNWFFEVSPLTIELHKLKGWRMDFKQNTSISRMRVHFHNKKNFGFRLVLKAKKYEGINDIFDSLGDRVINPNTLEQVRIYSSDLATTHIAPKQSPKVVEKIVYVDRPSSFEDALSAERNRILETIGDYRGVKSVDEFDYSNVINIDDYLKNTVEIQPSEEVFDGLMKSLG